MNKHKILAVLTLASICLAANTVSAGQFTITVPVRVSSLPPNVDGMLLACLLYTNEPRLGGRNIGVGRQRVNIAGGAYSGNATISFDVTPGQDPATATHYGCTGSFVGNESGATVHYFAGATEFPLAAGAPFRLDTGIVPIPR